VIDEGGIGIVGALGIIGLDGLGAAIAVIHPDGGLGAGLEVGDLDPDESGAHEGIEALDVKGERGLVIRGDEADVAAIFLGGLELEVAIAEAEEDGGGADGGIDGDAFVRGIDDDLLANGPIAIPPGIGGAGESEDGQRAEEEGGEGAG